MDYLSFDIERLDNLFDLVMSDNVDHKKVDLLIRIEDQIVKRINIAAQMVKIGNEENDKSYNRLKKMNVIGGELVTKPVKSITDKCNCPIKAGSQISREECFDLSGEENNMNSICKDCNNFETTRKFCFGNLTKGDN